LFGHIKGAFTGATRDKKGLMSEAGTLFLDEVSELPLQSQAKLLRAIQSKEIRKVGSEVTESINCRIVCATNKRLSEEPTFRTDLYARISTFEIDTKPLSKRTEDIPLIIKSMDGGSKYLEAINEREMQNEKEHEFDISLNVRSIQKQVKRYKVLGKI
jgi:transcriptional regulator with GAF, ATPase, and Fis domain